MRVRDPQGDIPFVDLGLFRSGGKDQDEAAPGWELDRMNRVAGLLHGQYSLLRLALENVARIRPPPLT